MPDEHESVVAAWLDDPHIQREIAITRHRYPSWNEYHVIQFTLGVMTYEAITAGLLDPSEDDTPPDAPDEPWRPRLA